MNPKDPSYQGSACKEPFRTLHYPDWFPSVSLFSPRDLLLPEPRSGSHRGRPAYPPRPDPTTLQTPSSTILRLAVSSSSNDLVTSTTTTMTKTRMMRMTRMRMTATGGGGRSSGGLAAAAGEWGGGRTTRTMISTWMTTRRTRMMTTWRVTMGRLTRTTTGEEGAGKGTGAHDSSSSSNST